MNKFSIKSTYIAALPRSYKRRGGSGAASPISGSSVTGDVSRAYVDENFVDLASEQDIFGIKNFVNGLKVGGILVSYNADKSAFVFPANAIFEGGVAWNSSLDGFEPQTVTDAVNVDGVTIGRTTSGALTVLAGAGGGINEAQLADYLTNNNYAKKSDIPSLSGYATEAFVTSRGYITSAAIPTKVSTFDNDSGYITGITSSMVTSALGYTPYNTANFTKSNIKSTLGISDWALASAKPSYIASEVGALGVNATAQSALKMTSEYLTDLNSATPWRFFDMGTGYGSTDGNKPNTTWVSGITGTVAGSSNYRWQLAGTTGSQNPYFRQESNGNWNDWKTLAFTSDIPTKLSQLTDDVVAGKYLPLSGGTLTGALNMNAYFQLGNNKPITVADTDGVYQSALYLSISNNLIIGYGTSVVGKRKTALLGYKIEFKSAGNEENTLVLNANRTASFSSSVTAGGNVAAPSFTVNGSPQITYNADKNVFVFPANAIFEGGVAWNSPMDGTSAYASELERRIEALQTEVDTLKQTVQTLTA